MNTEHLVKMVNEIAAFFDGDAGPGQAATEVATHMGKYWEMRMRKEIVAHYHKGAAGMGDTAKAAVALLAERESKPAPA